MKFPDPSGGKSTIPNLYHPNGENDSSPYRNENSQVHVGVETPPEPGSESVGPALYDLVRRTSRALDVQSELIRNAIPLLNKRIIVEAVTGQTDASGNLDLVLFRVPQGFQFITTRVNIEDGTHTPATPYTNAAGWIGLMRSDKFQPGSLVDFIPNPGAASGAIIPASITDGATEAGVFRGGETVGLHVATGPVTTDIWVRLQGILEPV